MTFNMHALKKSFKYAHGIGDLIMNHSLKSNHKGLGLGLCLFSDKPMLTHQKVNSFDKVKYSTDAKQGSTSADSSKVAGTDTEGVAKGINKKTLDGGVVIQDVIIGAGTLAKRGKTISVYYSGRLKSTNKVFDELTTGPGLSFRLGKGEVIDGWDIGVVGMKVGGKRIISCPPAMAYGVKGSPPVIPPNSTLIFDVEVKDVK